MILLDTDHLTVLRHSGHPRSVALMARLDATTEQRIGVTVISLEEQMRGWLAAINRRREIQKQVPVYEQLTELVTFFRSWKVIGFDERAAEEFERLRKERIRIGTQDLKIASIVLVQHALLLSANLRDFGKVPDLRVENWLEG